MPDLFIGRQPIFDANLEVVGYELLHRSVASPKSAPPEDGDIATTQVILNCFSEVGLDTLVNTSRAFINVTANFINGKYPIPFSPERVVLEVLEDIPINLELMQSLVELRRQGFLLALDDTVCYERIAPLLKLVNFVKIDLSLAPRRNLPEMVRLFKQHPLRLVAEKVETLEDLEYCRRLGFDYFQGFFLCKPVLLKKRRSDALYTVILQSLAALQNPETNFARLEEIISQDVSLGYKLIKLINSAYYGASTPITSIRQAISLIGFDQLRSWMTLLLLTSIHDKPRELNVIAMSRARMCELLARARKKPRPDTYFMTGLFSVLDSLMNMTMENAIETLPFDAAVSDALLNRGGDLGAVLSTTIAYETGDWDSVMTFDLGAGEMRGAYLESIQWASQLLRQIEAPIPVTNLRPALV